jgi:chromosome partitioning protein
MCKIIAIANQKGGVAKTTTTSNLGIGMARKGKKVLLLDADAQGSLTASLGFTEPDRLEKTLATVMTNIINEEEMAPEYGILKHEEGIDLMPGNIELSGLEVSLVNVMSRELVLRAYIETVRDRYDYILIDCMPSLGMITINVFACADSILIPVQAAYLPVKGLEQLIKTIGKVKRQINPKLTIEGILLTMVDSRTNYARDISALLTENYGDKVRIFENRIPLSVRAAEISAEGVSIYLHDPKGKVADAYRSLTEEVLGNE